MKKGAFILVFAGFIMGLNSDRSFEASGAEGSSTLRESSDWLARSERSPAVPRERRREAVDRRQEGRDRRRGATERPRRAEEESSEEGLYEDREHLEKMTPQMRRRQLRRRAQAACEAQGHSSQNAQELRDCIADTIADQWEADD